jgi:putative endonuclease
MTNKYNTVLYIGMTNNLVRRIYEHKKRAKRSFTKNYNCHKLVWYREMEDIKCAKLKEKQMKNWKREYKENVVNEINPDWKNLFDELI